MIGLLCLAAVIAQESPPTFRTDIKLIQVSVIAQDKKGEPVADLRRQDFQILDNGSPREVRLFLAEADSVIPTPPELKAPGVFSNQVASATGLHSHYSVILLDNLFTDFGDPETGSGIANSRISALRALRSIPVGKVAIYATGRKLQVVCAFTSDRDLIRRQLERWKPSADTPGGAADAALRAAARDEEMTVIADHLAGVPGRRNLIWLSRSFAFSPQVLQKFSSAGVAMYPVDLAGVCSVCPPPSFNSEGVPISSPCHVCEPPAPTSLMDAIAARTGGVAYYLRNDIDVAIGKAMDDGRVGYTLGFYRSDDDTNDKVHQIDIRVSRPGIALRYSTSYQPRALPPLPADANADLVRAMNRPIDATAIPIRASATRVGDSLRLKAVIDAGSLELTQTQGRWRGREEIVARFIAAEGKPVGEVITQTMNLHLSEAQYNSALQHGLGCTNELKIPAKAAELKLLFTDLISGKIGTLTIPLSEVVAGGTK